MNNLKVINNVAANAAMIAPVSSHQYSPQIAYVLAQASAWVYSDLETQVARMQDVSFSAEIAEAFSVDNSALFLNTYATLLISESTKTGILVFRGTEFANGHYVDLLTDAAIDPVQYKNDQNSQVHGGFLINALAVWPKIIKTLLQHVDKMDRLYFTGHSLGGALSVLCAAELFLDLKPAALLGEGVPALYQQLRSAFSGVYTFGQPMVGDLSFAQQCESAFGAVTFRHVYKADIVPQLPPKSTGRFEHFGQEFRIEPNGKWVKVFERTSQAYTLLLSLPIAGMAYVARQFSLTRRLPFKVSLADHSPLNYLDAAKLSI